MVHVWHCFADFCQRTAPSHPSQAEARKALATFRHLWSDPPELETIGINCLFDRFAGKIIGRSALGPNPSNLLPGAKLIRQFAARRVSDESSEAGACLRSEDIKSHGISSFAICLGHLRCHCGFANLPSLLFRRGYQPSRTACLRTSLRARRAVSAFSREAPPLHFAEHAFALHFLL